MSALTPEERDAAHARQQKRYRDMRAAKQYAEREHIRSEIPTRAIVQDLIKISDTLKAGFELKPDPVTQQPVAEELDRTRISALSKAAEIKFKLLNKTVPDLKQVELRADVTEEALPTMVHFKVIEARPAEEPES